MHGNCYATSEALYHLLGGKRGGWKPETVRHRGVTHWYLVHECGLIVDPTARQFPLYDQPPYHRGRGRGFLTKGPSRKARELMKAMVYQENM